MICENCEHKHVCRYKDEVSKLEEKIQLESIKQKTPEINDVVIATLACKYKKQNYLRNTLIDGFGITGTGTGEIKCK